MKTKRKTEREAEVEKMTSRRLRIDQKSNKKKTFSSFSFPAWLISFAMRRRALMSVFNTALKAGSGRVGSAVAQLRAMSSSSTNNTSESAPSAETLSSLHRPLRLLLFATLAGAAAAVLPQTFAPSPQAAVALLRADSARLRGAGAERARKIGSGSGGSKGAGSLAAVPGAAAALLDGAFREEVDGDEEEAAAAAALKAAVAWAGHPEGAAALREAGAAERAEAATKRESRSPSKEAAEDAKHLCWLLQQEKR